LNPGFWSLARSAPELPLVFEGQRWWRAGEVLGRSRRWGWWLRQQGLLPGGWLWLCGPVGIDQLTALLAALEGGYAVSIVPPHRGWQELLACYPQARLVDLPTGEEAERQLADLPDSPPPTRRAGQRVFFGSGSGGLPQAVLRPFSEHPPELLCQLAAQHLNAVCGIRRGQQLRHLVVSPPGYSASLLWCSDHLLLGHSLVLAEGAGPQRILELIEEHQIVSTLMVPTHFYRLLGLPDCVRSAHRLDSLRYVVHTGARCPLEVKRQMLQWWGPVLYEVYGAAEGAGTRATPQEWLERPGTVGRCYGRIRVQRPDGTCCGPGEVGEVWLRSGRSFVAVGDRGWLDADDYLFLQGRSDEVIITGGVKVSPAEVEAVLVGHPAVREALVGPRDDPEWGQRVHAWLELVPGSCPATVQGELERLCGQRLAGPQRPRSWEVRPELPRLPWGKLDRQALLSASPSGPGRISQQGPPHDQDRSQPL